MKHLYVLRHGETLWNVERRMQGRMDSPLTERGREQASTNGQLLKALGGVEQLWVSPSGRTTETAYLLNSHVHASIEFVDQLMERDCGQWSGLLVDDIQQDYPEQWSQWRGDPYWYQPPGGENLQDMLQRVHEFLDSLFEQDVVSLGLVTHGVMSRVILKYFLGLAELECTRVLHPNDVVYRLTFHAEDIDTHHFEAGGGAQAGLKRNEPALEQHPVNR